jgi:hypothetical protein
MVAATSSAVGDTPNLMSATMTISELKGRMLPAKKAEKNIPGIPHSINICESDSIIG